MNRAVKTLVLTVNCSVAVAQIPVPFVAKDSAQHLFVGDRFLQIEDRPVRWSASADGILAYLDASGDLKRYDAENDVVHVVETGDVERPHIFGSSIVYEKSGALVLARTTGKLVLTEEVGAFTVSDSLIVFHDREQNALRSYWKGRQATLAELAEGAQRAAWTAGTNTVVFHERSSGRLFLYYHGELQVLADSCDIAKVAAGTDLVAYIDGRKSLMVFDHGRLHELSAFLPVSFQAGDGIVAYVDMAGRLQAYSDGVTTLVSEEMPSWYTLQDSLLLFVEEGVLYALHDGQKRMVERYLPEKWSIHGALGHLLGSGPWNRALVGRRTPKDHQERWPAHIRIVRSDRAVPRPTRFGVCVEQRTDLSLLSRATESSALFDGPQAHRVLLAFQLDLADLSPFVALVG